ncbi:winged helix DNA-binding domain-containing protein [Naasia lichenicola]|nr:winged helix DNA-binding domain-containing protein [Naasia lichenicola]
MLVHKHHLRGDADGPERVTKALVALHATDPATVYLSVLARTSTTTIADVASSLYENRTLVRWMAMRRTLFVFPTVDVPAIQGAVSTPLAATLRRQLISRLDRNGSEPALGTDADEWLDIVGADVDAALESAGAATGAQLAAAVPALRTTIHPGSPSEKPQNVTSPLLTVMSTAGRMVRGTPTGPWTSRHHLWEPVDHWWPNGLPLMDPAESQAMLARRWLERYGPATADDLQWWTGWNKTTTRAALSRLPIEEVDLHGVAGIDLRHDASTPDDDAVPEATLLPSLDPTSMGWRDRKWFLGIDPQQIFDPAGNIGPTIWWNGEIIGSWAVARTGEIRTAIAADRGSSAVHQIELAAERLQRRLNGALVTPAIRTPLERSLVN